MKKARLNQYADRKKGIFKACQLGAHFLSSISVRPFVENHFSPAEQSHLFLSQVSHARLSFPLFPFHKKREGGKEKGERKEDSFVFPRTHFSSSP